MTEDNMVTPQRVVGLVIHIMKEIRANRIQLHEMELMSEDLIGQGYTESEISAAMSWVYARIEDNEAVDIVFQSKADLNSFRVLHPAEMSVVRSEAFGQLLEMFTLKILNLDEIERIIERAMSFGSPLGAEEIRMIVHSLLFEEGSQIDISGALHFSQPNGTVN